MTLLVGLRLAELAVLSALVWSGWYVVFLGSQRRVLPSLVWAQLLTMSQIVLSELVLGLIGWLRPMPVALCNLGIAAIVWLWFASHCWREAIRAQLKWFEILRKPQLNVFALIGLAAFLGLLVWSLLLAWYLPPREWDSLAFHLPIVATYFQNGAIAPIASPSVWVRYYPIDGELLQLWNVLFLHDDRIVEIAFVPAILAGLVSIYGLARELGASRSSSVLGAGVAAFANATLIEMTTSFNDALMMGLVAAGLYIQVSLLRRAWATDRAKFILGAMGVGAACGLCAGVKFNGAVYAAGLVAVFLYLAIRSRLPRIDVQARRLRLLLAPLGIIIVLGLALCAYPLVRNVLVAGNPLAPFEVHIGNLRLFEGQKEIADFVGWTTPPEVADMPLLLRLVTIWREPTGSVYDLSLSGLGGEWFAVGLPAGIVWLGIAMWRRKTLDVLLCLTLVAGAAATPAMWNPRYVMPLLIWGGVATALVLDSLTPKVGKGVSSLLVLLSLLTVFSAIPPYSTGPDDLIDIVGAIDSRDRSSPQLLNPSWGREAFRWIDTETKDNRAVIAYGKLVPFIYPLYGTDLRNRVIHVLSTDRDEWLATLAAQDVSIVIVNRETPPYSWTLAAGGFVEVVEDGAYVVFRRSR
ncbi:MAG: hypothetical protein NTY23_08150 [Chloroflexi bacterium]|nr:hypothetical protein [Chloroflexota bacterium]